ncbi:hypothetical protein ACWGQ5_54820 [Streptomyces sp. NPDC055722]
MPFAEWLYRFLIGQNMAGCRSAAYYPHPVVLEYVPTAPAERTRVSHGPERGM